MNTHIPKPVVEEKEPEKVEQKEEEKKEEDKEKVAKSKLPLSPTFLMGFPPLINYLPQVEDEKEKEKEVEEKSTTETEEKPKETKWIGIEWNIREDLFAFCRKSYSHIFISLFLYNFHDFFSFTFFVLFYHWTFEFFLSFRRTVEHFVIEFLAHCLRLMWQVG